MKLGNAITPLILIVMAVTAGAYAYVVDRGRVSDADRASRRIDVFPSFRVDQVRRIELVRDGETLVLERDDPASGSTRQDNRAGWEMTAPRHDDTDPAPIDALLRELEMATRVREVSDRDAKGLDAPRVRGRVTVGPLEYRFALGDDALTPEGAAYMRLDGEGTFVIERSIKVQLLRSADAYRSRELVPYGASEVARLEIASPTRGTVVLERRGSAFRIGGQDGLRASRAGVDHLFGALADARAEAFVDDGAADRAIADVVRTVVVVPRDATRPRVAFVVGGPCPSHEPDLATDVVVVRTAPARTAACVPRNVTDALAPPSEVLVDDSPLVARADEIEELRIEAVPRTAVGLSGPPSVELARRGTGWHQRSPQERDLGAEEVDSANALVESLAGSRALDVRPAASDERLAVRARTTVMRTGGGASEVVEVTMPDASGIALMRRLDDGAILRMQRPTARKFEPHPIALNPATVWRPPIEPAAVVAIDDSCSRGPAHVELDEGVWATRGFAVDNRSVADLADAFARVRADAWIAESDDGSFGFGRDGSCVVALTLRPDVGGDARRARVTFGAAAEGGIYAHADGVPGVFVAPSSLRTRASHPVIDRRCVGLDLSTLVRVVVTRGDAKTVLVREVRDGALERRGSDGGTPDALEGALGALRADWAVHTGPPAHEEGFDRPLVEIDATAVADGGSFAEGEARHILIAAPTREGGADGYFARVNGIDATFVVARAVVHAILDAW